MKLGNQGEIRVACGLGKGQKGGKKSKEDDAVIFYRMDESLSCAVGRPKCEANIIVRRPAWVPELDYKTPGKKATYHHRYIGPHDRHYF